MFFNQIWFLHLRGFFCPFSQTYSLYGLKLASFGTLTLKISKGNSSFRDSTLLEKNLSGDDDDDDYYYYYYYLSS